MAKGKKKDPDSNDSSSPLENQEEIDEWLEARQDPITRMWMATERYLEKLGNADWNEIDKIRKNQDWAEAKHQVKLIWHRIHELGDEASLDANRERVFLKTYVRALLDCYEEGGPQMPGLPRELIDILRFEYIGGGAAKNLLAFEEKKPANKALAIIAVKQFPDITQGQLASIFHVTGRTIRTWTPDLLAAGWEGPRYTEKSKEPVEPASPKRGTPSLPTLKFMEGEEPEDI